MAAQESHTTKQKSHTAKLYIITTISKNIVKWVSHCNNTIVLHVGNTMRSRAQVYNRDTIQVIAQQLKHRCSCVTAPDTNILWHNKHALWHRRTPINSQSQVPSECSKQRVLGLFLMVIY